MLHLLLIGTGGFFGAICRHSLNSWLTRSTHFPQFPIGILAVNLTGCLLIGAVLGFLEARDLAMTNARYLVVVGFLGGFTTFSTFGFDTFAMIRSGHLGYAIANVLISVIGGVLAVWIGYRAVLKIATSS